MVSEHCFTVNVTNKLNSEIRKRAKIVSDVMWHKNPLLTWDGAGQNEPIKCPR